MRRAARSIVAVMLTTVLLGVALYTLRTLRHVDPRGRASWSGGATVFDATPRDLPIFLPACDVRAIVLHPAAAASGRLGVDYVRLGFDKRDQVVEQAGAGGAEVLVGGGHPVELAMGDVAPHWRETLTLRVRVVDYAGQPSAALPPIALDPMAPVTVDAFDDSVLGRFTCAFDAGSRMSAWAVVIGMLVVLVGAGGLGAGWVTRAGQRERGASSARLARGATPTALFMVAATSVVYSLVVPPFEPPDELAHLQYARLVATSGTLPRAVPPADSEWRAASYEFVQQPLYYLGAAALLKTTGLEAPGPALTLNPLSRMQPGGTEPTIFQHGEVPADDTGHRALRLLRLVSLLMALATTWLIARLLTTVTSDPLVIATVAGGLGLIPQWCAVMGAVSTDPPATLLAAAATLCMVRVASGRRDRGWLLMTGVLIGAAYAVKATAAFLVPMALLACVLGVTMHRPGPGQDHGPRSFLVAGLGAALVIGAGTALAGGWVHLRAWLVFGDPSAIDFKRAVLEAGGFVPTRGPMPWTPEFWTQMRVMVFEPFWARFGSLGAGPFPGSRVWLPYAAASVWLVALACWGAVGSSLAAWRRIRPAPSSGSDGPLGERALPAVYALSVCGVGVGVGLAAWIGVNLVPQADMVVHWTPRHLLPLTAPAALLVAAGLERLRHGPSLVRRGGAAATGLAVAALALAWIGVLRATVLMFHFGY